MNSPKLQETNEPISTESSKTAMPFRDLDLQDEPAQPVAPIEKKVEKKVEPKPEKEVVYVEKHRRGRGCRPGCGCRSITCGGCLIIILLIVGLVYLIATKPSGLWKWTVEFLNDDIQVEQHEELSYEDATADLNNQIEDIGDNQIIITEEQLTAMGRKNIPQLKGLTIETEPNTIKVLWKLDQTVENEPLWGTVEISKNEANELVIDKIGTNRLALPSFVNKAITDIVLNLLDFGANDRNADSIFNQLVDFNEDYQIKSINIEQNRVVVNLEINVELF